MRAMLELCFCVRLGTSYNSKETSNWLMPEKIIVQIISLVQSGHRAKYEIRQMLPGSFRAEFRADYLRRKFGFQTN